MKNNFQSKSVPRGTRTIWRYLSALILLLTLAIGNVWGTDIEIPLTNLKNFPLDYGLVKITNTENTTIGSNQLQVSKKTAKFKVSTTLAGFYLKSISFTDANSSKNGGFTCDEGSYMSGPTENVYTYTAPNTTTTEANFSLIGSGGTAKMGTIIVTLSTNEQVERLTAFGSVSDSKIPFTSSAATSNVELSVPASNAVSTSSSRISIGSGGKHLIVSTKNSKVLKNIIIPKYQQSTYEITGSSDPAGTYNKTTNVWTPTAATNTSVDLTLTVSSTVYSQEIFVIYSNAASYTITYDANDGEGTMENSTNTVSACTFTAPTGKEFKEWNTLATGLGDSYDPGDAASSDLDLFAIWQTKVEKFTVKYMDGTTELGSEVVEVGQHPTGSEIADPTKDCYTFAGWDPALSGVSGSDGDEVVVNATWTPNYAFGAYSFVNVSEVGTAPNKLTMSDGNTVNVPAGSRVDNFYFSAMAIKYESGASTALTDYKGWKINTKDATIKFLVENNSQVKVAIGSKDAINVTYTEPDGTAKNAISQGQQTEVSYLAKAGTLFTIKTATANTTTLKRITISPLYNATYTTSKSSVDPTSASNVTEVTLPTPNETTVGGYSFTGWIATQTVYKGETAKTAGEGLDAGETYTLTANTAFTAQWQLISDFDVKFFQGYGDPDAQIGETQSISTGNFAVAPEDPVRAGFAFLGWSYDATEAHIVDVATYGITAATNFTAMWKAVWTVTFDGAGNVIVEDGEAVASPDSPTQAGKIFQGWYNGESKYDFSAAVTGALALTSKWVDADPNHFVYAYNDDFHFDGVVYKTPEGKVDNNDLTSNKAITTPYTLFSGAGGITSIVATGAIYDSKGTHVNAFLKLDTKESSYLTVTIASGYTAVMKVKMGSWNVGSAAPTVTFVDEDDTPVSYTGTMEGKAEDNNYAELTYNLSAGTYKMTTATKTLYFSNMDIEATALPTHTVTYKAGEGTGDDVEDADATNVADVPSTFSAPTGKVFNGWKDESDNDVAVGAIVEADMTLTAQWINHYAVTFNMNGYGDAPAEQDIKHGEKATKPAAPVVIGQEFGGWFTDNGTFEAPFDFETPITAATPLYAKWTAFDGCVELWPATSGETLIVGAMVDLQTGSTGGSIKVANLGDEGSIAYNANGLSFSNGGKDSVRVTLNNELKNGSVIKLRIMANGATHSKGRGLNLYNAANAKEALLGWQADEEVATGDVDEFTYTVEESDGFAGTNIFILQRQNSVFLQSIKVTNCGAAIVYHNLTSAVNIAGKGTATLGATSVREGYTTTATYSDIDPLYEFVNWTVSGAGTSIADASANPATITMGTEDAVVTLNLRLIPVKFTVEYYDGATLMGSEQVAVNENPTASEIVTAKRHYTFLGWSETDGGNVVALNTITRTEAGTVKLYAKYEPVACPTSGTIFSMEFDETKKPGETVKVAKNGGSIDMAEYATISGGNAMIINNETDNKDAISEDGEFLLKATKEVMKIELNCVLQEGDIIRIPDNSAKLVISTSNAKTGTYQAFADKNTHEFAVTAAWAGVDDIYVLYDGSSLKFTKVYVIRPAKFDVSFNMMGHGTQIADIEDVIEGSKITAPTAPTDEDYSFAGWYKETTLENVWNFAEDVVTANTTLFAKWIDKSDATLKSLKYGETEIALEAGVYTYNVSLPAFTLAVPALMAETSNPNATKVIANAAAFDSEGNATSTVTVTPEVGADQVYTVNFAKGVEILLQDVTGSITWNFANAVTANVSITETPQVLANYGGVTNDNTFESDKLEASGEKFTAGNKANLRANYIHFHTTVPGMLTISYSNTGSSNPARYIYVNGAKYDEEGSANTTPKGADNKVFVPAGDVELVMKDGEDASKNVQIYQMIFNATPDYKRNVTEGRYGTICLPTNGVMIGTTIYTLAFYGATSQKIFFDEVVTGRMEAGKPYLFLPEQGVTELKVFYTDSETKAAQTVNGFHGYIGDSEDPEDALPVPAGEGNYIVQNNTYREVQAGATAYILSHRAYIKFSEIGTTEPAKAPGARRIGLGKDAAQGFENIESGDQPMKVMIDGTLYIIRGEKVYNANGQVVK